MDIQLLLDKEFCLIPIRAIPPEDVDSDPKWYKMPAIPWKEFQNRKPIDKEIENWFKLSDFKKTKLEFKDGEFQLPLEGIPKHKYNVAVICGKISGKKGSLVVLDFDDADLADKVDIDSFTVETPSGGKHVYVYTEDTIKKIPAFNGYPLDVQGESSYVLAPPSITQDGEYKIVKDVPIKKIKNLLKLLEKKLPKAKPRKKNLEDFKKAIHDKTPLLDYVKATVPDMRSCGHDIYVGCCPFHTEESGSFKVYNKNNSFFCYGCSKGGDIFTFVMLKDEIDFNSAVTKLEAEFKIDAPVQQSFPFDTEIGNGDRLVNNFGENIRFNNNANNWLIWNEKQWIEDTTSEINRMAQEVCRRILFEELDERIKVGNITTTAEIKRFNSFIYKSQTFNQVSNMIKFASANKKVVINSDQLDRNKFLLNVQNGTFDLKAGTILPHDKDHYITKIANVNWEKNTQSQLWLDFLDRIFAGNKNLISFVQRAIGYSLSGDTKEECLFIFYGTGANGKSTLILPISHMLNDYARQESPKLFLVSKHEGSGESCSPALLNLKGARFITVVEPKSGGKLAEDLLKAWTGGEEVQARGLWHKKPTSFAPEGKIFMVCNYKPVISGINRGTWRRIFLVPFTVEIPEAEWDKDLKDKFKSPEHLPSILNWALEGWKDYQKQGLNPPQEVLDATEDYRQEQDFIGDFISGCCKIPGTIQSINLYQAFKLWSKAQGNDYILSIHKFAPKMQEKGFKKENNGRIVIWQNIGLQSEVSAIIDTMEADKDGEKQAIKEMRDFLNKPVKSEKTTTVDISPLAGDISISDSILMDNRGEVGEEKAEKAEKHEKYEKCQKNLPYTDFIDNNSERVSQISQTSPPIGEMSQHSDFDEDTVNAFKNYILEYPDGLPVGTFINVMGWTEKVKKLINHLIANRKITIENGIIKWIEKESEISNIDPIMNKPLFSEDDGEFIDG
ncbi:DNA primase [uncultured archaeon]|nr:DNA primase [uncultured archaeon]